MSELRRLKSESTRSKAPSRKESQGSSDADAPKRELAKSKSKRLSSKTLSTKNIESEDDLTPVKEDTDTRKSLRESTVKENDQPEKSVSKSKRDLVKSKSAVLGNDHQTGDSAKPKRKPVESKVALKGDCKIANDERQQKESAPKSKSKSVKNKTTIDEDIKGIGSDHQPKESAPKRKSVKDKAAVVADSKTLGATDKIKNKEKMSGGQSPVKKTTKKPEATAKVRRQSSTGNKAGKIEEDSRIVNHLYDDNIFDSCKMFFRKKLGKS
jgi:hypothetical protein